MKYFFVVVAVCILNPVVVFAQTKPLKWGVEVDVIPFHEDDLDNSTPFSLSGFVGGFVEFEIAPRFTVNAIAGINNIYTKAYYTDKLPVPGELSDLYQKSVYRTTFEAKIEPRYYLFQQTRPWGNFYAAVPLSYETAFFQESYEVQKFKAIPSVGYQLVLSKHITSEVYGGIGWCRSKAEPESFTFLDYTLGVRLRYAF